MQLVGRLIRNYYEIYGSFDGIYNKLGDLLNGMDLAQSDLYSYLGYKKVKPFFEHEVYDIRKAIIQGETDKVKLYSQMSVEDVTKLISENDAPILPNFKKPKVEHKEYVMLLSNYLKYSRSNVTEQGDFRVYLNELSKQPLSVIIKTLGRKEFVETASTMMPTWKYVEGVEPIIQLGVFYVPEKLSAKDKKSIQENAIKDAVLNTLAIHEEYAIVVKSVINTQVTEMYESNIDGYRAILDLAMFQNVTVKELLNSCNLNVVNYVEQYIKHRCIFYMVGDRVSLTVSNGKEDATISLEKRQFKSLYEKDNLDYLTVQDGKIYLNKSKLVPLSKAL